MAVTRRQFVAGMGALAASMGFNSAQIAKITEALADPGYPFDFGPGSKPKVLWLHGAECTGCSISTLSLFEDARGKAIRGTDIKTIDALGLAADDVPRTLHEAGYNVDASPFAVNVQDILVDWIDLHYHENLMAMGGDLAYTLLEDNLTYDGGQDPFVLVVEGSTQSNELGGAWETGDEDDHPWCAVAMDHDATDEIEFDRAIEALATREDCLAVISIGQCSSFGGYPSAVPPKWKGEGDNLGRQTGSMSTFEFLQWRGGETKNGQTATGVESPACLAAANKVVNVPGCPPNPWWFVLTVVAFLIDLKATWGTEDQTGPLGVVSTDENGDLVLGNVDHSRRLNAVYGTPLHAAACVRYPEYLKGNFATKPGEPGCLQLIGCKAPATMSLCGVHGWSGQQPENRQDNGIDTYGVAEIHGIRGGNCIAAGHPCMGCTEPGYPDAFVPFIPR